VILPLYSQKETSGLSREKHITSFNGIRDTGSNEMIIRGLEKGLNNMPTRPRPRTRGMVDVTSKVYKTPIFSEKGSHFIPKAYTSG